MRLAFCWEIWTVSSVMRAMFRFSGLSIFAFTLATAASVRAADNAAYNMPDTVTGTVKADEVMKKMETTVKPEVLETFKKEHPPGPSEYWLFGEDRNCPIRANIIPAHWFQDDAKNYRTFTGTARPGEFYVFQVGIVLGDKGMNGSENYTAKMDLPGAKIEFLTHLIHENGSAYLPQRITGQNLMVSWVGIHIPANAKKGTYSGKFSIYDEPKNALALTIKVDGPPINDEGVNDAWRLARLKWLNSQVGESETLVTRPFTPIKVDEKNRTLDILGRRLTLGRNGIPEQFTSYFSGSNTRILKEGTNAFIAPPKLTSVSNGNELELSGDRFKFTKITPVAVSWEADIGNPHCTAIVYGTLEYDGRMSLQISPASNSRRENGAPQLDDMVLTIPLAESSASYAMGLGLQGGSRPDKYLWKWDVKKHQDAIWLGSPNIGSMLRFKGANYQRPLINAYYDFRPLNLPDSWGGGDISWQRSDGKVEFKARTGRITSKYPPTKADNPAADFPMLALDWYFTPFKPLDVKKHFTDRYYHAKQGAPVEDTAKLKADGVNIVEIHHNRLCNPYINYPFNDDSFGHLKEFVKKAHADDVRVNLYYTTRELTQTLPEFFALKSMAGEIILPRKEGVAWPVTNSGGPHPWLKEHAGEDIVPAWRENLKFPEYQQKLDLAVITTPDSRWNNFYLEGLDYLIKKAAIDGLYIDDTALDRKSMQRARRILDADGNAGRRVSMHSWNHFNGLAKWSNSSIAFMELYPYYDGLWHGESFNANASPEFMLVEMSGIPYGLMSEMLDHPNPWHGMVFGMRTRWPWSGDPRNIWKLEDLFGIADSEYAGWWDPACPVKTDNPQVKASVYRKDGKTLIALASWAKETTSVKLAIDWKPLGLASSKTTLWAPACDKFQPEKVFRSEAPIPVEAGKGWLLIADEQQRNPSSPEATTHPE